MYKYSTGIIMHIGNIVQEKIKPTDKKRIKSGSGNLFSLSGANETEDKVMVNTLSKPNISTIWMLQEIDGYEYDRERAQETGKMLLNHLRELRISILSGGLAKDEIKNLQEALDKSDIDLQFPELRNVIEEIKLRFEIELAKIEKNDSI